MQQRHGHLGADDRGRVQQALLVTRESVDARGQDRLDAGRDLDGMDGCGEAVGAGLAHERLRLYQGSNAFLEEERVPVRPLDQKALEVAKCGVGTEEDMEEFRGIRRCQRINACLCVVGLAAPPVLILRTVADEHQNTSTRQSLHKTIEESLGLGISPVKVLEHDQERLCPALSD